MVRGVDKIPAHNFVERCNKICCYPYCHGVLVFGEVSSNQVATKVLVFP